MPDIHKKIRSLQIDLMIEGLTIKYTKHMGNLIPNKLDSHGSFRLSGIKFSYISDPAVRNL